MDVDLLDGSEVVRYTVDSSGPTPCAVRNGAADHLWLTLGPWRILDGHGDDLPREGRELLFGEGHAGTIAIHEGTGVVALVTFWRVEAGGLEARLVTLPHADGAVVVPTVALARLDGLLPKRPYSLGVRSANADDLRREIASGAMTREGLFDQLVVHLQWGGLSGDVEERLDVCGCAWRVPGAFRSAWPAGGGRDRPRDLDPIDLGGDAHHDRDDDAARSPGRDLSAYLPLRDLLQLVDPPHRVVCETLVEAYGVEMRAARGSTHNHQAWPGGYLDHVREVMNVAVVLYAPLDARRPLPFSLSDALVVLFLHDLEKPWAFVEEGGAWVRSGSFRSKDGAQAFRAAKIAEYGPELPARIVDAVRFVEGEIQGYSNERRAMGPLAAFCHLCDVTSARIWFDMPSAEDDPWPGAGRSVG